ncbi:MAG: stage V sporulation protein AB [Lachnospiraceae bacterium]|nr:stage V sporulation protein AB [Lachnospiraceae bacterium]
MWMTDLFLILIGLVCGLAVAAGAFALIAGLGLIPRLAGKTSVASCVIPLENAVIYGGLFGAVVALFGQIPLRIGSWFTVVYGLSAGVFTGCLEVALAEVLNVFPILFRRVKLKQGLNLIVFFFALGKTAGALYYFTMKVS